MPTRRPRSSTWRKCIGSREGRRGASKGTGAAGRPLWNRKSAFLARNRGKSVSDLIYGRAKGRHIGALPGTQVPSRWRTTRLPATIRSASGWSGTRPLLYIRYINQETNIPPDLVKNAARRFRCFTMHTSLSIFHSFDAFRFSKTPGAHTCGPRAPSATLRGPFRNPLRSLRKAPRTP